MRLGSGLGASTVTTANSPAGVVIVSATGAPSTSTLMRDPGSAVPAMVAAPSAATAQVAMAGGTGADGGSGAGSAAPGAGAAVVVSVAVSTADVAAGSCPSGSAASPDGSAGAGVPPPPADCQISQPIPAATATPPAISAVRAPAPIARLPDESAISFIPPCAAGHPSCRPGLHSPRNPDKPPEATGFRTPYMPQPSICVFCGSRPGTNPAYAEAARAFGVALAGQGWRLVYGAGDVGLMGETARAARRRGPPGHGGDPNSPDGREQGKRDLTHLRRHRGHA
jgi:hypothetical protein